MNLEHHLARFFRTPGHQWLRQAHPWSTWSDYLDLPLLMPAVWSRGWLVALIMLITVGLMRIIHRMIRERAMAS